MASASMNHYEKQLYSVFKSFDVDNEEALDRSAALQLCDTLQLEGRGDALVDTLFQRHSERVTFAQFRNGLLSVLGGEPAPLSQLPAELAPRHSDEDSSAREVAPKFVYGSKKYGRRSRPTRVAPEDSPRHRVASESRLDSARARPRMRCKRSASAMETRDDDTLDLDHDERVTRDRALTLCRGLHMHGVDRCLVNRIFEASKSEEITIGEFFDQLNSSLTSSIAVSLDESPSDSLSKCKTEVISSDVVVEAWERAGVERPRRLLIELGFTAIGLRPHDLECALEDELRAFGTSTESEPDARSLLLLAAHALARLRLESAWRLLEVARAERDKLRDDLAEANRRARLLAQDVDENHARIESELKSSLHQLEARHTEATRLAFAEAAAERERAAAARAALEQDLTRRVDAEARLRTEAASLRERIDGLQDCVRSADARAAQAEREQARLQEEARAADARVAAASERERVGLDELNARQHELRAENQRLRDRNDELCAALESEGKRAPGESSAAPSWREEVAMQASPLDSHLPEALELCGTSLFTKEKKPSDPGEVLKKLRDIFDHIEKLPSEIGGGCPICKSVGETIATLHGSVRDMREEGGATASPSPRATGTEVALQTDSAHDDDASVESLKKDLLNIQKQHETDKQNLTSVIKELECSLEQLKVEYDSAEEYWACKVEEERALHAQEQRAGDERLADLAARIQDYERQFALPTIHETYGLELQFNHLEEEFTKYKKDTEQQLADKVEEIKQLKSKLEEAERGSRGADAVAAVCGGGCAGAQCGGGAARWRAGVEAGALRARAARAERTAQRLHARLATADLLVKDLYIENCRLAHLPHLPRLP